MLNTYVQHIWSICAIFFLMWIDLGITEKPGLRKQPFWQNFNLLPTLMLMYKLLRMLWCHVDATYSLMWLLLLPEMRKISRKPVRKTFGEKAILCINKKSSETCVHEKTLQTKTSVSIIYLIKSLLCKDIKTTRKWVVNTVAECGAGKGDASNKLCVLTKKRMKKNSHSTHKFKYFRFVRIAMLQIHFFPHLKNKKINRWFRLSAISFT